MIYRKRNFHWRVKCLDEYMVHLRTNRPQEGTEQRNARAPKSYDDYEKLSLATYKRKARYRISLIVIHLSRNKGN